MSNFEQPQAEKKSNVMDKKNETCKKTIPPSVRSYSWSVRLCQV